MVLISNNRGMLTRRKVVGMSMASEKVVYIACLVMFQAMHKQRNVLTGLSSRSMLSSPVNKKVEKNEKSERIAAMM